MVEDGAPAQETDIGIIKPFEHGSSNEGQHRRVSTHKGTMNLNDVLRAEVLREYKSNKSDAMLTTMEKGGEDWDGETLVDGVAGPSEAKLASVKKMPSGPKERKKGGESLIMGQAPSTVDDDDLLMDTEVSRSQGIRDHLRRLVRDYLDDGLSLLEMDCTPLLVYATANGVDHFWFTPQPARCSRILLHQCPVPAPSIHF